MLDWDNIRVFVTVAQEGSALAAAKRLGVNQTTVARRIATLESDLGVGLFERRQSGYFLTEIGTALLSRAEQMSESARQITVMAAGQSRLISGRIRVTATEIFANRTLVQWMAEFMEVNPDVRVDLIASERRLDIVGGEADVAIRAGNRPTETGVVFRKLFNVHWAIFCSKAYAARRGVPKSIADAQTHPIIGVEGYLVEDQFCQWFFPQVPLTNIRTKCVNMINLAAAISAGQGIGPLPYPVACYEPDLVECFPLPPADSGYYLVTNAALKDLPRIRAFTRFIMERVENNRHLLDGRAHFRKA